MIDDGVMVSDYTSEVEDTIEDGVNDHTDRQEEGTEQSYEEYNSYED